MAEMNLKSMGGVAALFVVVSWCLVDVVVGIPKIHILRGVVFGSCAERFSHTNHLTTGIRITAAILSLVSSDLFRDSEISI
jgi:hypothetical protein